MGLSATEFKRRHAAKSIFQNGYDSIETLWEKTVKQVSKRCYTKRDPNEFRILFNFAVDRLENETMRVLLEFFLLWVKKEVELRAKREG